MSDSVAQPVLVKGTTVYSLSVVIATLGGGVLRETLDVLNSGSTPPAEILICIPELEAVSLENFGYGNVRVLATPCRGQVAQRAYGLQRAQGPFVMQMDDDILIAPAAVDALLHALHEVGDGCVVAPLFCHIETGEYITKHSLGFRGWLHNLYVSGVCGAPWGVKRMGKISSAGIGYWVDRTLIGDEPFETEWVPGGCALARKQDLVTENYFPFPGKAFGEDLIHSIYWRRMGVRMWAIPRASCLTQVAPMPFVWRMMLTDFRAHLHAAVLIDGTRWRLYVWFLVFLAKQTVVSVVRVIQIRCFKGGRPKVGDVV